MKHLIFCVVAVAISIAGISVCVAGSSKQFAPDDAQYLTVAELTEIYSGKTTLWTNLRSGKTGKSAYNSDGTYSRGTWRISEDGYKCNFHAKKQKESCARVYKEGDLYITVNKKGQKKYSFTVE